MKTTTLGLFAILFFSSLTYAGFLALGTHQEALKYTQDAIADHSLHGPQDPSCPQAGIATIESTQKLEGRLTSAREYLPSIEAALNREAEKYKNETGKCGSCKQNNVVTPVTVTRPRDVKNDPTCENRPIELVRGDFSNRKAAEKFIQDTLDGDNQEGKRIYAGCPDPCSFYVYNATSPLENGKTRAQLIVQCGQPRKGMFAKYTFSGALVHEWTCSK